MQQKAFAKHYEKYQDSETSPAMHEIEKIHGVHNWELLTMLDAKKNRYLYEKMGYISSGQTVKINEKLTLIIYRKV